jgi:hypothetical protein
VVVHCARGLIDRKDELELLTPGLLIGDSAYRIALLRGARRNVDGD